MDGPALWLRPLEPEDTALVREIFDQLGETSRYQRFLVPKDRLTSAELRHLTAVDHWSHEALVALTVPEGRPVGVARFIREAADPAVAEVAVEVVDSWHRRGVGIALTQALVLRARDVQVRTLCAVMTHQNTGAARLLRHVGGEVAPLGGSPGFAEYRIRLRPAC